MTLLGGIVEDIVVLYVQMFLCPWCCITKLLNFICLASTCTRSQMQNADGWTVKRQVSSLLFVCFGCALHTPSICYFLVHFISLTCQASITAMSWLLMSAFTVLYTMQTVTKAISRWVLKHDSLVSLTTFIKKRHKKYIHLMLENGWGHIACHSHNK